jgi:hypothetical protein
MTKEECVMSQVSMMVGSKTNTPRAQRRGLNFSVAQTLDEVLQAWRLVHRSMRRGEQEGGEEFCTEPEAVGRRSAVILVRLGELVIGTVTGVIDGEGGLPADRTHRAEMAGLRQPGRRLLEVCLFGDRRGEISRAFTAVTELMRFTYFYARHNSVTDLVTSVHPRLARFYARYFHFSLVTPRTGTGARKNILLRRDLLAQPSPRRPFSEIAYFMERPLGPEVYSARYAFPPDEVVRSPIGVLLERNAQA